jgi:hypothetical protein
MAFVLSGNPVSVATASALEEEAKKQYDVLYAGGANRTAVGNGLNSYIASAGVNDTPADVKAGLLELAQVATALADRVQV